MAAGIKLKNLADSISAYFTREKTDADKEKAALIRERITIRNAYQAGVDAIKLNGVNAEIYPVLSQREAVYCDHEPLAASNELVAARRLHQNFASQLSEAKDMLSKMKTARDAVSEQAAETKPYGDYATALPARKFVAEKLRPKSDVTLNDELKGALKNEFKKTTAVILTRFRQDRRDINSRIDVIKKSEVRLAKTQKTDEKKFARADKVLKDVDALGQDYRSQSGRRRARVQYDKQMEDINGYSSALNRHIEESGISGIVNKGSKFGKTLARVTELAASHKQQVYLQLPEAPVVVSGQYHRPEAQEEARSHYVQLDPARKFKDELAAAPQAAKQYVDWDKVLPIQDAPGSAPEVGFIGGASNDSLLDKKTKHYDLAPEDTDDELSSAADMQPLVGTYVRLDKVPKPTEPQPSVKFKTAPEIIPPKDADSEDVQARAQSEKRLARQGSARRRPNPLKSDSDMSLVSDYGNPSVAPTSEPRSSTSRPVQTKKTDLTGHAQDRAAKVSGGMQSKMKALMEGDKDAKQFHTNEQTNSSGAPTPKPKGFSKND